LTPEAEIGGSEVGGQLGLPGKTQTKSINQSINNIWSDLISTLEETGTHRKKLIFIKSYTDTELKLFLNLNLLSN
jgi:hypothetical protein